MTAPAIGLSSPFASSPSQQPSQQPSMLHTAPPAVTTPSPPQLTAASTMTDDSDRPFVFYPEYEEALVPPPPPLFAPHSTAAPHSAAARYWSMAGGDYSHVVNPVIAPGLLLNGYVVHSAYSLPCRRSHATGRCLRERAEPLIAEQGGVLTRYLTLLFLQLP